MAKTVTIPAVSPDEAFIADLVSKRDEAANQEQSLQQQYITQEAYFEREAERLEMRRKKTLQALSIQIGQHQRILAASDAALEAVHSNVVQMKAAE